MNDLDAWKHWASPISNGHVRINEAGEMTSWRDHPGCRYCEVLSGRAANRSGEAQREKRMQSANEWATELWGTPAEAARGSQGAQTGAEGMHRREGLVYDMACARCGASFIECADCHRFACMCVTECSGPTGEALS